MDTEGTAAPGANPLEERIGEFEFEIRRGNHNEVARRLAEESRTQRGALRIFFILSEKFIGQTEVVEQMASAIMDVDVSMGFRIAEKFLDAHQPSPALALFEKTIDLLEEGQFTMRDFQKSIPVAMRLGKIDVGYKLMDVLLENEKEGGKLSRANIISIIHDLAPDHMEHAMVFWGKLHEKNIYKQATVLAYRNFRKKFGLSDIELNEQDDSESIPHLSLLNKARPLVATERRAEMPALCEEDLSDRDDINAASQWIQLAREVAVHDLPIANAIWAVVLRHQPQRKSSFLHFSKEFNAETDDPEIHALMQHANSIPDNKSERGEMFAKPLVIDTVTKSPAQWLLLAETHRRNGKYEQAFRIWHALLRASNCFQVNVAQGIERIVRHFSGDIASLEKELRIPETLSAAPGSSTVYRSVAASLRDDKPDVTECISRALFRIEPRDSGHANSLAHCLIYRGRFDEAVDMWFPLHKKFARSCAQVASMLIDHDQEQHAARLFAEVAKVDPVSSIAHGYQYFQSSSMNLHVLDCIEPLLPTGQETALQEHQLIALRLLARHDGTHGRVDQLLAELRTTGAVTADHVREISSIAIVTRSEQIRDERDREIERYLKKFMPTLGKSKFFRDLRSTSVDKPGKRTATATRNVLGRPRPGDKDHP